jgi:hypothetical protein
MRRSILAAVLATTAFAFAARPAAADGPALHAASAPAEGTNSINLNPLSALWGNFNGNYEHLFGGTHGLVVEAAYERGTDADTGASYNSYGGAIGYRYHWSHSQASGFLGAMLGFGVGNGLATVTDNSGSMSFDMSIKTLYATVDIGKRWTLGDHLNITARIGAGRAVRSVTTDSTDPKAQTAVSDIQSVLDWLPVTLDGELSLGYTF